MYNQKIADIFDSIADMLEFKQDNPFKIRAYRNASQLLRSLPDDIRKYAEQDNLTDLPGIGTELCDKIKELIETGKLNAYEKLKSQVPKGVLDIMSLPGVGPKTAKLLYDKLRIDSVEKLKQKAESGDLAKLSHIKEKTQQNILKAIGFVESASKRMLLGHALPVAENIIEDLKSLKEVEGISLAGSLRRMKETIGDIDILITSKSAPKVMKFFIDLPYVKKIIAHGATKSSVVIDEGAQVDLRVVKPACYGAALIYLTGSKAHNVSIRKIAVSKKLKINEYGVFKMSKVTPRKIAGATEEQVYKSIGLGMIPPEIREDAGEIEASLKDKLPSLVRQQQIKGDLHVHSELSDGTYNIKEIARICMQKGYEYVAITDHSQSLKVANGLSEKELLGSIDNIRKLNKRLKGFRILTGAEVDISSDGTLDYPDNILKDLDIVIAAIHSGFKQSRQQITGRILKAMDNRYVNIIAHPSGRLLGTREAYDVDLKELLRHAKAASIAVEINANPERLDLDDIHTRAAIDLGVKLVISTDAHRRQDFDFMRLGVAVARRGWAERSDILNTLPVDKLLKTLKR